MDENLNSPEAYDKIYTAHPGKWRSTPRDINVYLLIQEKIGEPQNLLDVGCGNGHTIEFLNIYWKKTIFCGIDISPVAIKVAAKIANKLHIENAVFLNQYLEDAKKLGKYHVVTCMGVAEHFPDVVEGLKMLASHLSEDGILYLECPNNLQLEGRTDEGWYRSTYQEEWYLKRETWEQKIKQARLKIISRYQGGDLAYGFIWLLEREKE